MSGGVSAVKMGPQLWNGKLAWMLGKEVLQDDVKGSAGNAEEIAAQGLKVRDTGEAHCGDPGLHSAFQPRFWGR